MDEDKIAQIVALRDEAKDRASETWGKLGAEWEARLEAYDNVLAILGHNG